MAVIQDAHPMMEEHVNILLDSPIDITLNHHFKFLPAFHDLPSQQNFFRRYFLSFFTAVLLTPRIDRGRQFMGNYVVGAAYARKMSDNIRIFVYNGGSSIIFHNIHLHKLLDAPKTGATEPIHVVTKEEYSILNAYFKMDHGLNNIDGLRIVNYEYEVKKVSIKDGNQKMFKVRMDLIPNESTRLALDWRQRANYKQLLIDEPKASNPRLSLFQKFSLFTDYVNFNRPPFLLTASSNINFILNYFDRVFSYFRPTTIIFQMDMRDQVALAGLFHGAMAKSLPEVLNTKTPFLFHNLQGEMFWQFHSDHHASIVDFTPENHETAAIGFRVAEALKTKEQNSGVEMIRLNYDSERRMIKFSRRFMQYTIVNFIQNLEQDLREMEFCPVKVLESKLLKYQQHIQNIIEPMVSNSADIEVWKACLVGIFKSAQSHSIHLGSKAGTMDKSLVHAILLELDRRIILTFDNQGDNHQSSHGLHMNKDQNVMLIINLYLEDRDNSLKLGAMVSPESELHGKYAWRKTATVDTNGFLQDCKSTIGLERHPQLTGKAVNNFHIAIQNVLEETTQIALNKKSLSAYLSGIFSHTANNLILEEEHEGSFSKLVELQSSQIDGLFTLNLVFRVQKGTNSAETAASTVYQLQKTKSENSEIIVIVFDPQNKVDKFSVASSMQHFNTKDVHTICKQRRKRNSAMQCPVYKEDTVEEKVGALNYENIEANIKQKYGPLSKLHRHLSKLQEFTSAIQLAFIGRDLVGDLVQGDVKSVTMDMLFFGSTFAYRRAGEKIVDLGVRIYGSGMLVAGRSVVALGRCLPNLGFDIYMGYQLSQQIKEKDTVDVYSTATYLGLDLLHCTYEALVAFGVLGMTPIVGQVTMLATTALLIGQNFYETIEKMNEIVARIRMTAWEYEYEGLREFFHLGLDENMQELMNEVEANEILTNNVIDTYPNFSRIIISAATLSHKGNKIVLIEDNDINLQVVREISKASRVMPRKSMLPKKVELFCLMIEEYRQSHSGIISEAIFLANTFDKLTHATKSDSKEFAEDAYCRNAFGIKHNKLNATEDTLFILANGRDNVRGFLDSPNVFLLENGLKHIHGGDSNDTFIIRGSNMSGELDGVGGFDTVDFTTVDMDEDSKLLIKHGTAILQKDNRVIEFKFYNIENIIGRENSSDHVIVCNQTRIDLKGSLKSADKIFINNKYKCLKPNNLTIILRNNTHISCSHKQAQVRYIADKEIESYVDLTAGNHYFEFESLAFSDVIMTHQKKKLLFQGLKTNLTIQCSLDCKLNLKFSDDVITEWNRDFLLAHLLELDMSLHTLIEKYSQCLHNNLLVKFYAATQSGTFVWDHDHFLMALNGSERLLKIISNKYENDLILMGYNAAENYFLITAHPEESIDLTIHVNVSATFPCHIDLSHIAREIHSISNGSHGLLSTVHQMLEDIVLELFAIPNDVGCEIPDHKYLGKLTITHGMNYVDNIILYLYQQNSIVYESNELFVKSHPIRVDNETVVILPGNFDFFGQIFVHAEYDNLEIYSMDKSLIITNAASLENNENIISVALVDYFSYRNKFSTLKLSFGDRLLSWKTNARLINAADDISLMWIKIDDKLKNSSFYKQQEKYIALVGANEWDCQLFHTYSISTEDNKCLLNRKKQ